MAVTYELDLDRIGVSTSRVTGIATSDYVPTGLIAETNYRYRVRLVDTTNGVVAKSLWTAWVNFTTTAVSADIVETLGLITNTQSVYAINENVPPIQTVTVSYDVSVLRVGFNTTLITGITDSTYALTGLVDGSDYQVKVRQVVDVNGAKMPSLWSAATSFTASAAAPQPVIELLGSITNTQTIYAINDVIGVPTVDVDADHWVVTVKNTDSGLNEQQHLRFTSDIDLTDLAQNVAYEVSVVGILNGLVSEPLVIAFTTQVNTEYANTTESIEQALDVFTFTINTTYSSETGLLHLFGNASTAFNNISGQVNGKGFVGQVSGNTWGGYYTEGELLAPQMDELDGQVNIQINVTNDLLEIN